MSTEGFLQALSHLLPTGWAWPRSPDSVLMRVLRGLAASFSEHHDTAEQAVRAWQPHLTARLAEWEDATALPDACFGVVQTDTRRRQVLLARLGGAQPLYGDSSPGAPGGIAAACATLGYEATVRYNTPFRAGRDRCGRPLGRLDGRLYVVVATANTRLRVGGGRVGSQLITRSLPDARLECYLTRIIPARFELQVVYTS